MKSMIGFCVLLGWGLGTGLALAQPDLTQTIGQATVVHRESEYYRFESFGVTSLDQERRYRIHIGIPKRAPASTGYPVIYLLDGNAALLGVDEAQLAKLCEYATPPVIVFLSYDNDLRIDSIGRSYDYTPSSGNGQDVSFRGRRTGGADIFLDLIESTIKPGVQARIAIDPSRQTIWGHSFGGLFVLHALFSRPEAFNTYIAVDPALWWNRGQVLREAETFLSRSASSAMHRLIVYAGTGRRSVIAASPATAQRQEAVQTLRAAVPKAAAAMLVKQIDTHNAIRADYRELSGLTHGQTLPASVLPALRIAAETTTDTKAW